MSNTPTLGLLVPTCAQAYGIGIYMPPYLLTLEREVGAVALRAFLFEWAGREINIPVAIQADMPHAAILANLRDHFGPGRMTIASGPVSYNARLAWSIYEGLRAGRSGAEVARHCGCHARTVSNHKKRLKERGLLPSPRQETPKGPDQ